MSSIKNFFTRVFSIFEYKAAPRHVPYMQPSPQLVELAKKEKAKEEAAKKASAVNTVISSPVDGSYPTISPLVREMYTTTAKEAAVRTAAVEQEKARNDRVRKDLAAATQRKAESEEQERRRRQEDDNDASRRNSTYNWNNASPDNTPFFNPAPVGAPYNSTPHPAPSHANSDCPTPSPSPSHNHYTCPAPSYDNGSHHSNHSNYDNSSPSYDNSSPSYDNSSPGNCD